MLEDIIDSKFNSEILGFFLSAVDRGFSVKEISKRLKIPHLKAAHALNQLVEAGYLKSFAKRGKKYYLVNRRNKLVPDLRLYFQKQGLVFKDEMISAVKKLGDIRAAFLSGIFAGLPHLPVDILLVGRINLRKLADFLKDAQKLMGQEINYSVMTEDEFLQRRNTFDRFIRDIFDYHHIVVVDNLSKKKK